MILYDLPTIRMAGLICFYKTIDKAAGKKGEYNEAGGLAPLYRRGLRLKSCTMISDVTNRNSCYASCPSVELFFIDYGPHVLAGQCPGNQALL